MPIEIIWSPTALDHLQAIYEYILADNPAAALDVHEEIERTVGLLQDFPALAIRAGWWTPENWWCLPIPPTSSYMSCTGTVFISWPSCMAATVAESFEERS